MSSVGCVEGDGVLLYYKYAPIPDVQALVDTYGSNCGSLGLLGRVRIARDGVNVTIGGKMAALKKHIEAMRRNSLFEGTDFKLAPCNATSDEKIASECGFTALSIRIVEELVTFRLPPLVKSPTISNAGKHLSAIEFHSLLHNAGNKLDSNGSLQHENLLLLDARNLYETRIGFFQTPGVETMNPKTRQYSDLPVWIDENSRHIRGKHVLMYCTGGIRCEMASSYIRSKGVGYENVYQLFGGIQRYLEQFPDGGFFKGRNFVFDHRISVGSENTNVVGSCLLCGSSFDDYSTRCRCNNCRMLVLVCVGCQLQENPSTVYVCELCQKHAKKDRLASLPVDGQFISGSSSDLNIDTELGSLRTSAAIASLHPVHGRNGNNGSPRKLRILCLHGFRQNALSFKGRTASLAKKLRSIAEFIFVDGFHELPFVYQPRSDNPDRTSCSLQHQPLKESCKKRFAWLVSPMSDHDKAPSVWKMADQPFDPNQYQQQTDGFDESFAHIKNIFSQMGPFDGILGFSQGAAMVALICQQLQSRGGIKDFRFAILCSGFSLLPREINAGSINIPSLHIFGSNRSKDRQIDCEASKGLATLFNERCSVIIEHEMGHIIPAVSPKKRNYKLFEGRKDGVVPRMDGRVNVFFMLQKNRNSP